MLLQARHVRRGRGGVASCPEERYKGGEHRLGNAHAGEHTGAARRCVGERACAACAPQVGGAVHALCHASGGPRRLLLAARDRPRDVFGRHPPLR
eukprot:3033950-Prymnesium_polylepis.1